MQILYILQNGDSNQYKIGMTGDLNKRIKQLQTGCPGELKVIKVWTHYQRRVVEKYERVLHRYYNKCGCRIRENGEWYNLRKPDLDFLCAPNGIEEQNKCIEDILKMM